MTAARLNSTPRQTRLQRFVCGALLGLGLAMVTGLSPAHARQTVEIEGEVSAELAQSLRTIVDSAPTNTPRTASPTVARRLVAMLRSEGYYGARVRPILRQNQLVYWVAPDGRFTVEAVAVTTQPETAEATEIAVSAMTLDEGAPLRAEAVIASEAAGLAALHEAGYPDAEALEREVVVDHDTHQGQIQYNFQSGPRSVYGDVLPQTTRWRPAFLERLADLPSGETAQLSALRAYQTRLAALNSVARAQVTLAAPEPETDRRDIEVSLTPAARHVVEGGFSLSTSEGAGVEGRWIRRNVFGGDETASVSAQLSTLEQSLATELAAPHWRRRDQTLTLHASTRNEETDAFDQLELEVSADVTRQINAAWTVGLEIGIDGSRIRSAGSEDDTVTVFSGLTANFDTRDSRTDPTHGLRASATVTPALTVGDIESGYVISEATLQTYRQLSPSLVLSGRVRVGSIAGASLNSVPADQRFYAGGGGSVRGFEFQSLGPRATDGSLQGGRSVVEASAEIRWRSEGPWGAVVFADAGNATTQTVPELSDLRVGIGAGVRYHFDFAPLRLDIAAPLDRRSDEASLHIYVGLGQAF